MKAAVEAFHSISDSIHKNCKDLSELSHLEKCFFAIESDHIDPQVYSRLMLSVYDLSNHYSLLQGGGLRENKLMVHSLSIKLKLVSMRMICVLMNLVMSGSNHIQRLDQEIELEALETMIISIRICLDSEVDCLMELGESQKFCSQLYSYYCCFNGEERKTNRISQDLEMLYLLNKFDLMRLTINESFKITELQNGLDIYRGIIENQSISYENRSKYHEYISNIVSEITLKLLKQGNTDCLEKLDPYLPNEIKSTLNRLREGELPANGEVNFGEVYELYWQITKNGFQSISLEWLESFVSRNSVYEGEEIFEAIILTNEPKLLEVWFNEANRRVGKPPNLIAGYECFISLLMIYINKKQIHESIQPETTNQKTDTEESNNCLGHLVQLCKQVMLHLIRENKDSAIPVDVIVEYIGKFMLVLVSELFSYEICKEMFENLHMISNKHMLNEVNKTMSALQLYYDLLNHKENEEVFKKFIKFNSADKSESIRLLKLCYEMQKGKAQIDDASLMLVKKKPEFALLFCEPKEKAMLLLGIDNKCLVSMPDIFGIFLSLLEENQWNEENLLRIANHLENFLLINEFSKLSLTIESCKNLKRCLGRLVEKENNIFSMLFLYLSCFCIEFDKIRNEQYGVVFNRYGKILKILDLVSFDTRLGSILKIIICKSCEKFKKQLQTGKCSLEAGEIMFLKFLYEKLLYWTNDNFNSFDHVQQKNSLQFVKFSLFEIYCIFTRNEEIEEIIDEEENLKVQQLYAGSPFVPKKYRLVLLRKLFKSNFETGSSIVTLNDMKELIELAESMEESSIYIASTIKMFGEKGKQFIQLAAQENRKLGEILQNYSLDK